MNSRQRITLIVAFSVCLAMFLYPPTGSPTEYGRLGYYRYEPLWEVDGDRTIDFFRLMIQYAFVAVGSYFFAFHKSPAG